VRLRTDVAKRLPKRENALYLVFKIIERLGDTWRRVNAPNLCKLVLDGRTFVNGVLEESAA
jgi:hypothetical protein